MTGSSDWDIIHCSITFIPQVCARYWLCFSVVDSDSKYLFCWFSLCSILWFIIFILRQWGRLIHSLRYQLDDWCNIHLTSRWYAPVYIVVVIWNFYFILWIWIDWCRYMWTRRLQFPFCRHFSVVHTRSTWHLRLDKPACFQVLLCDFCWWRFHHRG